MSITVSNSNVFSQYTVNKSAMYNKTKVSNVFDSDLGNKPVTRPKSQKEGEERWKALHDKKRALFDIPTIKVLESELDELRRALSAKESEKRNLEKLKKDNDTYNIEYNKNAFESRLKKLQKDFSELELQVQKKQTELENIVTLIYDSTAEERASLKEEYSVVWNYNPTIIVEFYPGYSEAVKYYVSSKVEDSKIF